MLLETVTRAKKSVMMKCRIRRSCIVKVDAKSKNLNFQSVQAFFTMQPIDKSVTARSSDRRDNVILERVTQERDFGRGMLSCEEDDKRGVRSVLAIFAGCVV